MVALACLLSFLVFAASTVLLARLARAVPTGQHAPELRSLIADAVDASLLPEGRRGGLADLALPFREAHADPCDPRTLVERVARALHDPASADAETVVRDLYQLQALLALPEPKVRALMTPALARLAAGRVMDRPIARVATVARGDLVDPRAMHPLNMGSRVRQPLGVVLYDEDGRVLRRAKVWCG